MAKWRSCAKCASPARRPACCGDGGSHMGGIGVNRGIARPSSSVAVEMRAMSRADARRRHRLISAHRSRRWRAPSASSGGDHREAAKRFVVLRGGHGRIAEAAKEACASSATPGRNARGPASFRCWRRAAPSRGSLKEASISARPLHAGDNPSR